jgi:tripartite-type tricarboxylate transporter receptor subunit TctC
MRADRIGAAIAAALFSTGVAAASVQAQGNYPDRPVTLIVPYAPGGVADVGMRLLSEMLSVRLHQQFVIENRPGAAGIVAAQAAAAAAPDGYTLLMTGNNTAIAAALFKSLPYNVVTDFASVSTAAFFNILLVTRAGSPLRSVQDVIAAAHANPGRLNIGTINPGSTQNLAAELFISTADIKAAIVPFRTSPDMASAVIRGDIDVAFEFYAAVDGLLADGKLTAIASAGLTRAAYLPDVPTVIERAFGAGGHAASDHRFAQPSRGGCHSQSGRPKQSGHNGHDHALEHAAGDDRANEGRHRQVGRGD